MAACPEPVFGYLKLAEKLFEDGQEYASGWNFGPDSEVATVEEVVKNSLLHGEIKLAGQ